MFGRLENFRSCFCGVIARSILVFVFYSFGVMMNMLVVGGNREDDTVAVTSIVVTVMVCLCCSFR